MEASTRYGLELPPGSRFYSHPRVAMTPHHSGASNGSAARNDVLFVDNLHRYVGGQDLLHAATARDVLGG